MIEYRIVRYKRERQDGTTSLPGASLAKARFFAKQAVEDGSAERVEVVDLDNVIVFRWPVVVREQQPLIHRSRTVTPRSSE